MDVKALISEEEYLQMSFEDRVPEYVEGELVERGAPNNSHSRTQGELFYRFRTLQERLPLFPRSELRVPVAQSKYRIVDLAVYARQEPLEELPKQLPLVVVEIVSPDDRYEDVMQRLEEFRTWGVPHVWLVDPGLRRMYVYRDGGLTPVEAFQLPEFDVRIAAGEILR
jgi:Uma2 family endonuclease